MEAVTWEDENKLCGSEANRMAHGGLNPATESDSADLDVPWMGAREPVEQLGLFSPAADPSGEEMIEAIIERCAGIDVGKKFVAVCLMVDRSKANLRRNGARSER